MVKEKCWRQRRLVTKKSPSLLTPASLGRFIACAFIFMLPTVPSWSQQTVNEAEDAAAVQALRDFSERIVGLSAQFEQVTADAQGYVTDRMEGSFYFQRPIMFRFAYHSPSEELIVADGESLWHYDPSLRQATVRAQRSLQDSPILLLTNWAKLAQAYRIETGQSEDAIVLYPSSTEMGLAWVEIRMEGSTPSSVRWLDEFGQATELKLTGLVVNPTLDDGLFSFVPPAGVDVLEGF